MGMNDAAEMLEVAKAECERLERYNAELQESLQEAHTKYVNDTDILFLARKASERERDAACAVIAEVLYEVNGMLDSMDELITKEDIYRVLRDNVLRKVLPSGSET
ncbi:MULTISPECIES: hypothetical protein [unclassified Cryobacterium]|uniref:hypothetical protein n=1 Tax=unclassified Cryobacterium TaxID=2649013 RepID=UPI00106A66AF|nr:MULTISPECIES: hypothetical protein [unclassified Cryobacterium]TFC59437.1 hypothetical protein E3O68_00625 [Cryobacterium sp. TMB3-1-2]TFC67233.1 hypothetical protein E3T21_17320 [Cryobacterium sp. TMB3-15]TFC73254.1 hypothetical protein E3T22_16735 [Cryobacterium sp. TMB3-10]TFD46142.1 hypothetical protein E3T58_01370 [Cryobacterium sp. TMB3-12]